ncbi:MAG: hypothetical protein WAO02_17440 [Verrucomicrobiia bacterium]
MKATAWPKTLKACLRIPALFALAGLAGLFLTACASVSRSPATVMSAYSDDFNSGSPGAKNLWDQVVATVNSGDYATALATLDQLQSDDSLLPRQKQAVQETEAAVKQQLQNSVKTAAPNQ